MVKISREELLKLAKLSGLSLQEEEIPFLIKEIESVLSYAVRVKELAISVKISSDQKINNVFREDVVIKTDSLPIIKQGPEVEADLFVVPKIIERD